MFVLPTLHHVPAKAESSVRILVSALALKASTFAPFPVPTGMLQGFPSLGGAAKNKQFLKTDADSQVFTNDQY